MKPIASPRFVALSLRLLAAFIALNSITVFLPESWIDSVLVWCGVGHVPDAILFRYLLRGTGVLLLALAALIWMLASDVVRYQPLVVTICLIFLIGAPVSWLIDAVVGLPLWWCILDTTICVVGGGIPLLFCFWPTKGSPNQQVEATAPRRCSFDRHMFYYVIIAGGAALTGAVPHLSRSAAITSSIL
jgi:hypothetical protein